MKINLKYVILWLIAILIWAFVLGIGLKKDSKDGNTNLSTSDIVVEYYEDDLTIECIATNNSKEDAERVDIVYGVYNNEDELVYVVNDIFSLKSGESKYLDLSMCDDYAYIEVKVFDVY